MRPLCYCMAIILLFCSRAECGQALRLSTDDIYPRATLQGTGINDRIIDEAFRRGGLRMEFVVVPAERALVNANKGIDDGIFVRVAGIDKIYPNLVMVPEKICEYEFVVFTMNPAIRISDWESLKPYDVGIVTGWKILEANIVGARSLTKVRDPDALFSLLMHERVDLVVFDRIKGNALIKKRGMGDVKAIEPALATRDMFLYLNKRYASLVPGLALAMQEMKRDGTFEHIVSSVLDQLDKE